MCVVIQADPKARGCSSYFYLYTYSEGDQCFGGGGGVTDWGIMGTMSITSRPTLRDRAKMGRLCSFASSVKDA